jgi:hypothetical protein
MEEVAPAQTRDVFGTFRKSAFGRTNLFLETSSTIFREIRSGTSAGARHASTSVFHTQMGNNLQTKPEGCACWHCCHEFDGTAMRLPRIFDPCENLYHVYGWYCSANCAKAYLLEHSTFDRGYQMNIFARMLRDVYDVHENINEAPPRLSLRMFGGPFDIEAFRCQTGICTLVTPPFVSYCMLIEERFPGPAVGGDAKCGERGSVRGLRRPAKGNAVRCSGHVQDELCAPASDGLYAGFLAEREDTHETPSDASRPEPHAKRTKKTERPQANGAGLGRFACVK